MSALAWTAAQSWSAQVIRLAAVVLMARLLSPEVLGLYAMAAAVIAALQLFVGQGVSALITQRAELEDGHVSAALIQVSLTSAVLIALTGGAGPTLAAITGKAELGPVLQALSPSFPICAVGVIAIALHRRRLDMRTIALTNAASEIVGAVVGVAMAWRGFGVWSLVGRQLATHLATALGAWLSIGRVRLPRPGRVHFGDIGREGRRIAAGNILVVLRDRLDELVVGYMVGVSAAGQYAMAKRQVESLTAMVPAVIHNLGLPLFSNLQHDREAVARTMVAALRGVVGLAWPLYALFAAASPLWVPWLLGGQWSGIWPLVVGLSLIAAIRSVVGLQLLGLIATGRSGRRLLLELMTTCVVLGVMAGAAPLGVSGVIACAAAATALLAPLEILLISRDLPTRPGEILGAAMRGVVLSGATAAIAVAAEACGAGLAVVLVAGGATFVGGLRLLFAEAWRAGQGRFAALLRQGPAHSQDRPA